MTPFLRSVAWCRRAWWLPLLGLSGAWVQAAPQPAWPQWGGPSRNFTAPGAGLAAAWPATGPRRLWTRSLGEGYSGIVGANGRLYTMYRDGTREVVVAVSAASGETIWRHPYEAAFRADMNLDNGGGPHTTPAIAGPLLLTAGGLGSLRALDLATGKLAWKRELWTELGGTFVDTGYSSSPLIVGDLVIVQVGGRGQAVMAFRLRDGSVAWKAQDFANSPASPTLITVGGHAEVVVFMAPGVAGLDPATGALLWQLAHTTRWDLNISTPAWDGRSLLFISSAYDVGSRVLELTRTGSRTNVREVWHSSRIRIHKDNVIWRDGRAYGSSGDFGPAFFTAVDGRTGQVAWQDRTFAKASFLDVGGRFLLLDEDGTLALVRPTATGLAVDGRVSLTQTRSWTVPTLIGTRLYVRDRRSIVALELGQ
jgi:outer membrane protein assembly factor BamB